jgi:hypothetical protein
MSMFMIGTKWVIALTFLGTGFFVMVSGLQELGADNLKAVVAGVVLGAISLALGVSFLRMTPSNVSEMAMRRYKG